MSPFCVPGNGIVFSRKLPPWKEDCLSRSHVRRVDVNEVKCSDIEGDAAVDLNNKVKQ
jgi:hypothetical protein